MPRASETVVLVVDGLRFQDWTSVMVRHNLYDQPSRQFRFTSTERDDNRATFRSLRIRPGQVCTVILAGELAITGRVRTRQVSFDPRNHAIELQGASADSDMNQASLAHTTGEYKDQTWEQMARSALGTVGLKLTVKGSGQLPQDKIPVARVFPGESVFAFIERYARDLGGVALTSDEQGNVVAMAGPEGSQDTVEEGRNILEGREVIQDLDAVSTMAEVAQGPGTNEKHGAEVTHKPFSEQSGSDMLGPRALPRIILREMPFWTPELMDRRNKSERSIDDRDIIVVTITVYGWLRPSGGLWKVGQRVFVKSPMLIMNQALILRSVVFTQDNERGTISVLDLVNETAMGNFASVGAGGGGGNGSH